MNLQQLVEAIDAQVVAGDIMGAFDQFAANDVKTLSGQHDITHSKTEKAAMLRGFLSNVATINKISRPSFTVKGNNLTESEFFFDFTNVHGAPLVYNEVIRRTWNDQGLVIEEYYLLGETLRTEKAAATKTSTTTTTKTTAKVTAAPKVEKAPAVVAQKAEAPKAEPAKAPASAKTTKPDDLTLIEGIGPKIAELLNKDGITTFAALAQAKPAAIKTILDAAGKRYQMHDPATWPNQAALARDGKTAELAKLQDALKGGRKA